MLVLRHLFEGLSLISDPDNVEMLGRGYNWIAEEAEFFSLDELCNVSSSLSRVCWLLLGGEIEALTDLQGKIFIVGPR